jgi:hypothetical protein
MATFVLVHGARHGAWVWPRTARILRSQGYDVMIDDTERCARMLSAAP